MSQRIIRQSRTQCCPPLPSFQLLPAMSSSYPDLEIFKIEWEKLDEAEEFLKSEKLMKEIRDKDAYIAQLLKQIYDPSMATPLALVPSRIDTRSLSRTILSPPESPTSDEPPTRVLASRRQQKPPAKEDSAAPAAAPPAPTTASKGGILGSRWHGRGPSV